MRTFWSPVGCPLLEPILNGRFWPTPAEFDDYGIRLTRALAQRLVSTRADLQSFEKQTFEHPS